MTLTIAPSPVPLRLDAGGTYRVGATRVTLDTVIGAFNEGFSAEQIVLQYPTLALEDVYSVVTYYLKNRDAVNRYLAHREQEAEQIRQRIEANSNVVGLRAKLLARREARGGTRE
jgi:uncharacterized protein (DUF433 family)